MDISEREGQGAVIPSDISEKENTLPTGGENQVNFPKKRKRHGKNKESYILTVRSRGEKILFAIVFRYICCLCGISYISVYLDVFKFVENVDGVYA